MIFLVDFLGISGVFNKGIIGVDRRRHDGIAKLFDNLQGDVVIGDPDPHALFPALEKMGDVVVCFQDIGVRPGQGPSHQSENIIVDRPGIIGKLAETVTNE